MADSTFYAVSNDLLNANKESRGSVGAFLLEPEYMPWLNHYGSVAKHMDFPEKTLYEMVRDTSLQYPEKVAYEFMDIDTKYKTFLWQIDHCAKCLSKMGVQKNDNVLICMPNCPQAIIALYALDKIGAISVMIHPLSAKGEIEFYVEHSDCKVTITLNLFYQQFPKIVDGMKLQTMIVSSIEDGLSFGKGLVYKYILGRKDPKIDTSMRGVVRWSDFWKTDVEGYEAPASGKTCYDPTVILYSGGTTGRTKGVVLSSMNFNSTALGMVEFSQILNTGEVMMAVMPIFHGFGLCACVHLPFCIGIRCILVPRFTPDSYSKLIMKKKPNFIAGVPTLYEHMIRSKWLQKADLSCLKGVFCGGDTLTIEAKQRIDKFLADHGCGTPIREGYGCTECLTANTITPKTEQRPGSIGLPMPNFCFKIVEPGTSKRLPPGVDGEICISAESVMIEYYKDPEETANTLKVHEDGMTWLHTGDIGCMDEDGFFYFKQRLKRIIITSGYNVYPSQVENVINALDIVENSCVIGIPDELRGEKVKAYIVLKKGVDQEEALKAIKEHTARNISKFAKPRAYEFIDALPMTKVGKIAYREIEAMDAEKRKNEEKAAE